MKKSKNYTFMTSFKGELANDLRGLYRSTYTNVEGNDVLVFDTSLFFRVKNYLKTLYKNSQENTG